MCNTGKVLGACGRSFAKPCMDTRRRPMAKFLAAWYTYAISEILCIKGKTCHEVTDEKGRLTQRDGLQEGQGWVNFHHGHKEQAEGQSHVFPPLPPPTHCSALVRVNGLIQSLKINLTKALSFCHDRQSQKFLTKDYSVTLTEQRAEDEDGKEEEPGKSILHLCLKKDGPASAKLFSSINCKCNRLAPVSCNGILSLMSSQNSLIQKRNYANKIISNHHCLQRRTTKSCSQENLLIRVIMLLGFLSRLFIHTVITFNLESFISIA